MCRSRSKIFGYGINDLDYDMFNVNGKLCIFGQTWRDMIKRCKSEDFKNKYPSYEKCDCVEEWLSATVFVKWMKKQDYENKCLDKDMLFVGNNIYGPDTCCFIDYKINSMLASKGVISNSLIGSTLTKNGVYQSMISNYGKREYIGVFNTEQEASNAYRKRKSEIILETVDIVSEDRMKKSLVNHSNKFLKMIKV